MTPLSTALRALAAEPAPKGTSPNVHAFVAYRLTRWVEWLTIAERHDVTSSYAWRETIGAAVEGSRVGSWERGQYERALAVVCAHLAAETGAAS